MDKVIRDGMDVPVGDTGVGLGGNVVDVRVGTFVSDGVALSGIGVMVGGRGVNVKVAIGDSAVTVLVSGGGVVSVRLGTNKTSGTAVMFGKI